VNSPLRQFRWPDLRVWISVPVSLQFCCWTVTSCDRLDVSSYITPFFWTDLRTWMSVPVTLSSFELIWESGWCVRYDVGWDLWCDEFLSSLLSQVCTFLWKQCSVNHGVVHLTHKYSNLLALLPLLVLREFFNRRGRISLRHISRKQGVKILQDHDAKIPGPKDNHTPREDLVPWQEVETTWIVEPEPPAKKTGLWGENSVSLRF
jgi:hypothetical protein